LHPHTGSASIDAPRSEEERMTGDFTDLINLYVFPTGRRIYAQRQVLAIATEREITLLVRQLVANIAADQATRDLELQWAGHDDRKHALGAPAVDAELDRAVSALSETVNLKLVAFGSGSKMGQAALRIRQRIFPMGMQAITALTYVEQHEAVSTLLRLLGPGGDLANQVEILRLDDLLERIGEVNERYGKLLSTGNIRDVTHDKIRKAQATGQRNLLRVAAWILGHYQDDDRDLEARLTLLGPIVRENEAIRVHRRNRRRPTDVDPETGEEIIDPTNPPVTGD
jgi:hypothetical protein